MKKFSRKAGGVILCLMTLLPFCASASGGITLNTTRVIYPQDAKQSSVSVRNTSEKGNFLVQSWVENKDGSKTKDFVITPPLYTSRPGSENILRVIYSGSELPRDRESLYFLNTKAIPSVDKAALEGKNTLILAAVTRIKLFVRPAGLKPSSDDAPSALRFKRAGEKLEIYNPTPYYLTVTNLKAGNKELKDIMVAPMASDSVPLPPGSRGDVYFSTVNDFGGVTPAQKGVMQ
ncbi:fimbria/pilus periplasmic chaperone [Erwinia sp. BNK-24-b]|uniref:fimbria/pilus periplasmic chaperone n=1 Tax=unclassified Erwinia TaxID=2622719 RepID=UPI0039BF832F